MVKRSQRSSPYPSYTIEHCIELVKKIYTNFGSGSYYAKREEIAKVLKFSAAYLQTQVSSANQYGLLELKQGEGYKPSPLFLSIHRPLNKDDKSNALITVFESPPLYSALIESFKGQILPTEDPLSNILLHRHNISEGANDKAASIFIENARYLNLLKEDNILVLDPYSTLDETDTNDLNDDVKIIPDVEDNKLNKELSLRKNVSNHEFSSDNLIPFNIPLKGKRTAQIVVPSDVNNTDFDFIINFINLMKQQFD